ncbi:MAG: hypothetical protein ACP5GI_00880 [Sulfolobales archaeon]
MPRVVRVVLDDAKHHPQHKEFNELAKWLADLLKVELKIIEEDYVYVNEHGEKDEFGFGWLPQLFIETDSGEVIPVLTKIPFDPITLKPDLNEAKKQIEKMLREKELL